MWEKEKVIMRRKIKYLVMVMLIVLSFSFSTMIAFATDYYEKPSGSAGFEFPYKDTNVLYYKNPHGNFNLRIYIKKDVAWLYVDTKYAISMYNNAGVCIWSATNQSDRTYNIGGNVTKIAIKANSVQFTTLYWEKK